MRAYAAALALVLSACGGGGDSAVGGIDVSQTPQVIGTPADRQAIVGQLSSFLVEAQGASMTFAWEEQPGGSGDWRASTGAVTSDGSTSNLIIGPVDIGMNQTRFRGRVSNPAGSVTSNEARLDVVWGTVATYDSTNLGFGPGPGGPGGSADGGSPGGGDGEGAGVGGGLGKTPRAIISIARVADSASLGSAPAGATSGLVRVKAGPGTAPVAITLRGAPDATYYDEGRDAMLPLPADQELHALVLAFDRHLGVTTLTEAGYRYALNNFLQDPAAVRAGTVPLKRTATPQELAQLTPVQIQLANEAIRNEINRILPARYALDSISTLPTPVDNTSPPGSITDNIFGRMQAVVGGLSLAAARFEPSLPNPGLTMNAQLADDLTDGKVDGLSLDQRSVFGAPGSNAYGPDSLPQLLADAADAQFQRFGDGSIQQPPAITGQPSGASITQGGTATLNVNATGSLLTFQWFRDGVAIPGGTRPELTTSLGGVYYAVVGNGAGTVTSASVTVTVVTATVAAAITGQPASTAITSGDQATFTVTATGTDLVYQWQLVPATGPATNIPGAESSNYTTGTAGTYRVRISNAAGTVTSQDVTLTVNPRVIAPTITTQPDSVTINQGQFATLTVIPSGSPLAFQWHNESGPIANANGSSYPTSTAGTYFVVVSNSAGSVQSNSVTVTVIAPPAITTQPASVTINAGQQATLLVVASGPSLGYQWQLNGTNIAGATAASYATGTAGSYTVIVTNPAGSVASNAATVTVVAAPVITAQPGPATVTAGTDHTFSVTATGADLRYQWYRDDGESGFTAIPGATAATYQTGTAGVYVVDVSNAAGTVRSTTARLTVTPREVAPSITAQPASVTINQGQTTTLSVAADGTSLQYQWRRDGVDIAGANAASYATGTAGSYTVVVSNSVNSVTSNPAVVTVTAPAAIATQPVSVTINQGQTATLTVVATGTGLAYQWRLNGNPIAGANAATYATGTAGSYTVVISNGAGSVTSNAATVNVIGVPSITSHPVSATINQGQTTTLSVAASGPSLSYQWQLGGAPITGANAASYATGIAGTYTVVVSNPAGSVTSNPATVTVIVPPAITAQPASVTINQGQTATLSVVATGAGLAYQWRLNGNPIAGANAATYATSVAGSYTVVVSNGAGSLTSNAATVNVIGVPSITSQPVSATINQGQTTTLSVTASGTGLSYQWHSSGSPIAGATASTYATGAAGTYAVRVSNSAGSVTSNPATVTVIVPPTIESCPISVTINQGQTTTLRVQANGSSLNYQWTLNGAPIAGATAAAYNTGTAGTYGVTVSNAAGSAACNSATVTVIVPPTITAQPASVAIYQGQTATLSVTATGTSPRYQWLASGSPISGATGSSYSTTSAGSYAVVVSNAAGSVTSNPAVVSYIGIPVITTHPASASIAQGASHTFTVQATGQNMQYQWQRVSAAAGPVNIAGATQSTYATGVAGTYRVVVSNPAGPATSNNATLTVVAPQPLIASQPESATIVQGDRHTFGVKVREDVTQFQWYVLDKAALWQPILNATSQSYTTGSAGTYRVVVGAGKDTEPSQAAVLTVITPPVITQQPYRICCPDRYLVVASGANLTYQWYARYYTGSAAIDAPIPNATSASLPNTQWAQYFYVAVTNAAGTTYSNLVNIYNY